ncbi:hypothetical protein BC629DRAFT_991871 [Irpex lacteus]|nr:hypothetical protein BC629DRAFT_991871 [Irpex lacteus]
MTRTISPGRQFRVLAWKDVDGASRLDWCWPPSRFIDWKTAYAYLLPCAHTSDVSRSRCVTIPTEPSIVAIRQAIGARVPQSKAYYDPAGFKQCPWRLCSLPYQLRPSSSVSEAAQVTLVRVPRRFHAICVENFEPAVPRISSKLPTSPRKLCQRTAESEEIQQRHKLRGVNMSGCVIL